MGANIDILFLLHLNHVYIILIMDVGVAVIVTWRS